MFIISLTVWRLCTWPGTKICRICGLDSLFNYLWDGFKRVIVLQSDGLTTELLLNKRTNVMHGKSYRFYFNQNAHAFSGIHRLDAAFDFGNFFGVEEVKE